MINELDFELDSTYTCICMPMVEGHTLTSRFLNIFFLCHQVAAIGYTFIEHFFSFYLPISHSMMYSSKKFVSSLIVTIQLQKSPKDSKEKLIKLERPFLSSQWKRDFCLDSCYSIKRNTNIHILFFFYKNHSCPITRTQLIRIYHTWLHTLNSNTAIFSNPIKKLDSLDGSLKGN